jgi:ABC-type nickel/cobalt efflux system permease component RcnA
LPVRATHYRTAPIGKLRDVLRRLPATVVLAVTALLVVAAPVFAHDGGEGLYGETNDQVVTNAGFILIIFFPLFCLVASLIQWQLEKRKYARQAAAKARAQAPGGW